MKVDAYEVRIIRRGDHYGPGRCYVHDQDDLRVEFWWLNKTGVPYMAGRYYASTLLATKAGLNLGDGLFVSDEGMNQVRAWLRSMT